MVINLYSIGLPVADSIRILQNYMAKVGVEFVLRCTQLPFNRQKVKAFLIVFVVFVLSADSYPLEIRWQKVL